MLAQAVQNELTSVVKGLKNRTLQLPTKFRLSLDQPQPITHALQRRGLVAPAIVSQVLNVTTWSREKHLPTSWVPFDIFPKPTYDSVATFPPTS